MKKLERLLHTTLCLALVCAPALANEGQAAKPTQKRVSDVRLSKNGLLTGVAVNNVAKPLANAEVVVHYGPHVIARTRTAKDGSFAVTGLRGGQHTVSIGSRNHTCRLWTGKTAPPRATSRVALNGDAHVVRAQGPGPDVGTLAVVAGVGVLGGVIGYNVRDHDSPPASP